MTHPDDRDAALEELLRSTLTTEATAVHPAGDGLTRIQHRVASRRAHRVWLRPLAAAGAVVAVGGAALGAYAATHHSSGGDDSIVVGNGSPSPGRSDAGASSPASSATAPASSATYPADAFFPFTSAAAEQSWEDGGGAHAQPIYTDAARTAQAFVHDFVGATDLSLVLARDDRADTATVELGRTMSDGAAKRSVPVTVVRMVKYGAAWLVIGADDVHGFLKVTSPVSGAQIGSPVTVAGPSYGVEESVRVDVRGASGSLASKVGRADFGGGSPPWSARVPFDSAGASRGAIVLTESSMADGGTGRIVAVAVSFGTAGDGTYPPYFYGVKNGRVTKYSSRDGAALSYLTPADTTASDPQRVGGSVFYISTHSSCGNPNTLMSVPVTGGMSTTVAVASQGYQIAGFGLTPDATRVAVWEPACTADGTKPQGLLVSLVRASHTTHTIPFPSFPPMVTGDPVWEADGTHVDAVVRTGNSAGVQRYDAFASTGDSQPACGGTTWSDSGLPLAVATDASGTLWVATETGGGTSVVRCAAGRAPRQSFAIANNGSPQDLAVSPDGGAVLVTNQQGSVWRWSGGTAADVTPRVPQPQVSW